MVSSSKNPKQLYIQSSMQQQIWLSAKYDNVKLKLTLEISESEDGVITVLWPQLPDSVVESIGKQGVMQGIYRGLVFEGSPSQTHFLQFKSKLYLSVPIEELTDKEVEELRFLARDMARRLTIRTQKKLIVPKRKTSSKK